MSVPSDWVWGALEPWHLEHARAVALRQLRNVKEMGLKQTQYSHTPDEWYQKRVGAEGEVAFHVINGRPLPSVEAMVSTWHGPDVGRWSIKTVSQRHFRLFFQDSDVFFPGPERRVRIGGFVLILNEAPAMAIMGQIPVAKALALRWWNDRLKVPCWAVEQEPLEPWDVKGEHAASQSG